MRVGLIAMSGVRAASEKLNRIGLTLPGIVERSRVVASLPSLSLLTLAAYVPRDWELCYYEIEDLRKQPALPGGLDAVAIASYTAQIRDAYRVAEHYRAAGVPVLMGGLHAVACPDEVARHCASVAVGEGELLWPQMLADLAAGRLRPRYDVPPGTYFDLADAPLPRFDLLNIDKYNRLTVQTSRGCPHLCDFCASSVLLTPKYAVKLVEKVIAEVRAIKRMWSRPFIEFADDNSFAARAHYKRLLAALAEEAVSWFTEADISIADDAEILRLMRRSGCRQVLIGLESPRPDGLDGIELRRNWKLRVLPRYEWAIREIQSHGITVNGCFILGLDGDTPQTFESIREFVERTGLFDVQLTVLTPFPGTPLYARLLAEGRILEPGAWEKCTLFDVNLQPRGMSPEQLEQGLIDLGRQIYSPDCVQRRRECYFEHLHAAGRRDRPAEHAR